MNNTDKLELELGYYHRDLNGRYIIRKKDKCIIGIIMVISVGIIYYNIYLMTTIFHIKT
jgi:hypothetical protein